MPVHCKRCVMDNTCPGFYETIDGCSFCDTRNSIKNKPAENLTIETLFGEVKKAGLKRKYDCVIGLSGGVDSSYLLDLAIKHKLRPLCVHMDNGWNTELAISNINKMIRPNNLDFISYPIDWQEYKSLLTAFINADVIDLELLYDNAMLAVNYMYASKYNIKYILGGQNIQTEGIAMPEGWNWPVKFDGKNIKAIAKASSVKISNFPIITISKLAWYTYIQKIKWLMPLNYTSYSKESAQKLLKHKYSYSSYKEKHGESFFTKFYQNYILPNKFGVDKCKVHLSDLILNSEISRSQAVEILSKRNSKSSELLEDIDYFLEKMKMSRESFNLYMSRPQISHLNYPNSLSLWNHGRKLRRRSILT